MSREHPVFKKPTAKQIAALAFARKIPARDAAALLLNARHEAIQNERKNPLLFGWEPPIWRVCDAILGLDWLIPKRFGADYGERMRSCLGFREPVKVLLINGGNRAGKSEYMAKRAVLCLLKFHQSMLWGFHTDSDMSVRYMQPLVWKYLPPEYKAKAIKSSTTYIAYNLKNGFSEQSLILPNLATMEFRNYRQERDKIEGGELGSPELERTLGFVADELIPEDWVSTLVMRLATRAACGIIGFTPVNGYTSTVKAFQDGGKVARNTPAWMMPVDGGAPDVARGLEIENCDAWLDGAGIDPEAKKVEVAGRVFETAPRVMRCEDESRAVVFFQSSDNPYGNPSEVWTFVRAGQEAYRRERWYGIANKMVSGAFPLFSDRAHVVLGDDVPVEGTNYMIVDPCSGRNMFMLWIRVTPDGRIWVYREWPNVVDRIPSVGVMGKWAEPSGDDKRLDGKPGPGARSLGWGLAQYKAMIAWFERWKITDHGSQITDSREKRTESVVGDDVFYFPSEQVIALDQWGAHGERIYQRFMDARFAMVKGFDADGMETLLDEFDRVGITFHANKTDRRESIGEGVAMINDALFYDENRPVDFTNRPRLMISDRCQNLLFAMRTWTGQDGQKGATKDPVDCLRMFFLMGLEHVDAKAEWAQGGGGCY